MGAVVQLAQTTLGVQPGRSAQTVLTIRNTAQVVDRFSFEVVGDAAEWVSFEPETLSLFPEATGTVNVVFSPPRSPSVPAGPTPFGVKVVPSEDPAGTVVEEGVLDVEAFSDVSCELIPRIATGRRSARARLAVDNRSNCPYSADLHGEDPAGALALRFNPPTLEVPPGQAGFVRVRIRPRKKFWRGPNQSKPFRVSLSSRPLAAAPVVEEDSTVDQPTQRVAAVAGPHPEEVHADGTMMQSALLPKWLLTILGALVALAAIAAIVWFTLLKPAIKSTAKGQVKSQLAAAGVTPGGAGTASKGGGGSGSGGAAPPTTAAPTTTTAPPSTTTTTVAPTTVSSAGVTVNGSSQAPGNSTQTLYTVPAGYTLEVTDLLIQNAAGDTGTLALAKSGTVLMQWSMANFRDLDYHWIAPTVFSSGSTVQMIVSGCTDACHPGIYYAGNLVKSA